MISKSPDTINYHSISVQNIDGKTVESENIISGVKCSLQTALNRAKEFVNGIEITYTWCIMVTDAEEINKIPVFNINDKIVYQSSDFKIINLRKHQKHVEVYI